MLTMHLGEGRSADDIRKLGHTSPLQTVLSGRFNGQLEADPVLSKDNQAMPQLKWSLTVS